MRQAITTKFIPATNTLGSRIKATASGGTSVTLGYEHALSSTQNHLEAAKTLADRMGWAGQWHSGGYTNAGFVFVLSSPAFDL